MQSLSCACVRNLITLFREPTVLEEQALLRITVEQRATEVCLVLEGRLEQSLVPELEKTFFEQRVIAAERPLIVDLCGLTGMDQAGESALQDFYQRGAQLRCADVMNEYLVERITMGVGKPLRAPNRPCASKVTQEIPKEEEEKESANRD
jgi:hypothetical protein